MKIRDSLYTNTPRLEVKKLQHFPVSVVIFSALLASLFFQYVKTTLANLNADGHEYFRLLISQVCKVLRAGHYRGTGRRACCGYVEVNSSPEYNYLVNFTHGQLSDRWKRGFAHRLAPILYPITYQLSIVINCPKVNIQL